MDEVLGAPRWRNKANFHEVVPGRVYRSAQPTRERLERWIERHGIRAVLSLRRDAGDEVEDACAALGVEHAYERLSGRHPPGPPTFRRLIGRLETLPQPLLIHCRKGIERTGFVSALARLLAGDPPPLALREFSLRHGFIPGLVRPAMRRAVVNYARWVRETGTRHDTDAFWTWLREVYPTTKLWRKPDDPRGQA